MTAHPPATGFRPAASYSRDEMITLLTAAAHVASSHSMMAAVYLLTYTGLPGRQDFARHVDVQAVALSDDVTVLAARVRDWDVLLGDDSGVDLTGSDRRMLEIAASYAARPPGGSPRTGRRARHRARAAPRRGRSDRRRHAGVPGHRRNPCPLADACPPGSHIGDPHQPARATGGRMSRPRQTR